MATALRVSGAKQTFGSVLTVYRGLGPGFDFLRIGLACLIVTTHAFLLTGNVWIDQTPVWFVNYLFVPMFFALSGFLVTGSATRLSLNNFLINRGLRILPALGVDIVFCALIVGPLMTTVGLTSYFHNQQFLRYFLNITGWIHYNLPGVFRHHFNTRVNGALWTVPYEMFCYIIMSGLIVSRWVLRPSRVFGLAVSLFLCGYIVDKFGLHLFPGGGGGVYKLLHFTLVSRGTQLLLAFLLGIICYQLRDRIPYSPLLCAACGGLCLIAAFYLHIESMDHVGNRIILIPAIAYITVFIGLTPVGIPKIFHTGDYSYGIYLYHDPILQVIISFLPSLLLATWYGPLVLVVFGLPCVALFATFSWHRVEKPILALRKRFSFVAKVRGVESPDAAAVTAPQARGVGDVARQGV